ncbi:methyltransferase domain-containing protein [Pseudomonas chlororaphis]|uniref:methyltransferase domain-containing protein n=1 Tax=Pseudomonas chlororaphis TaxID=587753 RepID=UPI0013DDFADF
MGINAVGVDVSALAVDAANKRHSKRFSHGSVLSLPFTDGQFDTVVSTNCLEHLRPEDVPTALREMYRVSARYVFLQITTAVEEGERSLLTAERRDWWETQCFEAGFRKHALYYQINPYEALNEDGRQIFVLLEKVPVEALRHYDLSVLVEERLLHTDMLREVGRRGDAHCIRYQKAAEFVRPGDRVLDVACGLGYGSYMLYAASQAESVLGVDLSDFGIAYANAHYSRPGKIEFQVGDAQALTSIADNSIDFIAAFETIEHVPEPMEYLLQLKRVLKPGGRVMVCAPNDWADETGKDPNPHHLHVYTWDRLVAECATYFLLEQGMLQTAGGAMKCHHSPRKWETVPVDRTPEQEAEWVLLLGMADPVESAAVPYEETQWTLPDSPEFSVCAFARDYQNPWLVRGMVAQGQRARSASLLRSMQDRVLATAAPDSVDYGAALCGKVYSNSKVVELPDELYQELLTEIRHYAAISNPSPHQLRWQVSLLFAGGELARRRGHFEDAIGCFAACASLDVSVYSPLLGNKVVDALHWLAELALTRADKPAARIYLCRAVAEVQRLVSGSWLNISGDPDSPLSFGLAEAAQLLDKASRAAYMLSVLDSVSLRPGIVYRESAGFFERQLVERDQKLNDVSNSIDSLIAALEHKDVVCRDLVEQINALDSRTHELAREVVAQDKHAQSLAQEVIKKDAHAQALVDEIVKRDAEIARLLAKGSRNSGATSQDKRDAEITINSLVAALEHKDVVCRDLVEKINALDSRTHELAREVVAQDKYAQSLAQEVIKKDAHAQSLADEIVKRDAEIARLLTQGSQSLLQPGLCGELEVSNKVTKTGIVIVSYNASEAVRITLASMRRAFNEAAYKVILVDNASESGERDKIREAMSHHIAEVGSSWRYIEQDTNLGFSGGNNVGISEFLADDEITHICLLNSDVIVTDFWLDNLLASDSDLISAVTNKADGEQCVPVDYQLELAECLDHRSETLHDKVYQCVSNFAERWHTAWKGNLVETDVTFFCVLVSKVAFEKIGLLDDTFFPGGFEDDDYCLRARNAGYEIHLARDVFIHHWGSASFGQLQYQYFSERAQRNKAYLENKHGITWLRRPEKPIVSFAMDVEFALSHQDRLSLQAPFFDLYVTNLGKQISYFESEFSNLTEALAVQGRVVPDILLKAVSSARSYGDLVSLWEKVVARIQRALTAGSLDVGEANAVKEDLGLIATGVYERVDCNFAIHAFITSPGEDGASGVDIPPPATSAAFSARPETRLGKLLWFVRRSLDFILKFDGIVFFGGYFYPERQSDGYFQRIQIVDRMFVDRWRVYVESDELKGRNIWFDRPEPNVLVLRINGSKKRRMLVRFLALLAVLRCRKIYFHSVLRMYDNRFGELLHLPFIRKAVDIHGVVPEEFRMHNDFFSAVLYEKEERLAVQKSGIVIVVTEAMKNYLQQKFRGALKARSVSFPIFPRFTPTHATRPLIDGKPVVVYAGGLHKWQQVSKMIDAIIRTADQCNHRFYCPEPHIVKDMLPAERLGSVIVEGKTHVELMTLYPECHYGFILREDIIVNRAACPTKLVEYLAMGIVPIVDCEDIGDFKTLGMRYITLENFLAGNLPDEAQRVELAEANLSVYERLKEVRQTGAEEIFAYFTPPVRKRREVNARQFVADIARRVLPAGTFQGRAARKVWRGLRPVLGRSRPLIYPVEVSQAYDVVQEALPVCDVLVQVDNFEAGGLENVVLDLNETLIKAGLRVVLLVQGTQGPAVRRAQELGQTVVCRSYSVQSHGALIDKLQPKVVLAHYSFSGVDIYREKGIEFVQVIHNIYMWFNDHQRQEFASVAKNTSTFVAVSQQVKDYSISRLGVPAQSCIVIPNGIDFKPFDELDRVDARARLRAQYGIADDEFVFIDIGSINHQKNHLGAIRAFEIAAQSSDKLRLLILGPVYEPELLAEMVAYIEVHDLQDRVTYCGAATNVHEYLAMSDAFVSATFFEGGPLTLLEAIKANIPVAMPKVGCASHFAEYAGIELVDPVYDMTRYTGGVSEMRSTVEFEQRLAVAMLRAWSNGVRPQLSEIELEGLNKERTYQSYVNLVQQLISGQIVQVNAPLALKLS